MILQKNDEMLSKSPILIFDTNIFLTGIDFNLIDGFIYTTPCIIEEIKVKKYSKQNQNILNKIYAALDNKKLTVRSPKRLYMKDVIKKSKLTGDFKALSNVDKELIALALELIETHKTTVQICSNDYSIENVCSELDIPFFSLFKDGIKSKIMWEIYCPHCKSSHDAEDLLKTCEICGSRLKRRPKDYKIY